MWQDFIFAGGSIVFAVALLPTVIGKNKPSLFTSLPTATILFIFSATYASLNLWFSVVTTLITAAMWSSIAVQTIVSRKHRK